jgi:hypothetical protein
VPREHCPICDSRSPERILYRQAVPVHQNLPLDTAEGARRIRRGDLDIRACPVCGFVFNAEFDPSLLDYGPEYENSQNHSPAFSAHMDALVARLIGDGCGRTGTVVEAGCGKGAFLLRLCGHPEATCRGLGYDPAYVGPESALGGRVRFVKSFYGPSTAEPADAVVCRHVIEHIAEPLDLLRTFRSAAPAATARLYLETPCADWIIDNAVPWDFFYEHCSLFSRSSLSTALRRAGFGVRSVSHLFGGQYLWGEGGGAPTAQPAAPPEGFIARARALGRADTERRAAWDALLDAAGSRGAVYAWGAGAKGVTFCNLADPTADRLRGVIDVNPAKQGRYVPGTGHPILPPTAAGGAAAVLVFNPNYLNEIRSTVSAFSPGTVVLDAMEA